MKAGDTPPAEDGLFTREEVFTGFSGKVTKRAGAVLFAVETQTSHLVARSRRAMERFLTEEAAEERELTFVESFALARSPFPPPTIQDIERHAPQWASIVPENERCRAAAANLLGQKYHFTHRSVPGIRAALGLDEEGVRRAYLLLYGRPLDTIFAPRTGPFDRLRWGLAKLGGWLESLPPFWTAFALTLTETVGAGILALPIALAGVGPVAGVIMLALMGLVNMLTIAFMAEAITRSGTIRYGSAFIGRTFAEYLGGTGSAILTAGTFIECFLSLLAFYVGFSATMADATSVPAELWVALLFLVVLYFLRRESINATVASALVIGAVNICIILILSVIALGHAKLPNLLYVNAPFLNGRPFEPGVVYLIFGVVLSAYFGHLSVSNCAKVVLRRDPSGRTLMWGAISAQFAALVLYSIWVFAVNGAIEPGTLAAESGTSLIPLAAQVGPVVYVFGTVFVILGMGMGAIHCSLGLFNLTREWIPSRHTPTVRLPRRRGMLLLQSKNGGTAAPHVVIGVTYLGIADGLPQFRVSIQEGTSAHHVDIAVPEKWDAAELLDSMPGLREHNFRLSLDVQEAAQDGVLLRVGSSPGVVYRGELDTAGLSITDIFTLPDERRKVVNWMMRLRRMGRESASLPEIMEHTCYDEESARKILDELVAHGFIQELEIDGETRYRPYLALRRRRQIYRDAWKEEARKEEEGISRAHPLSFLFSGRWRFTLSMAPVAVVMLLAQWLFFAGSESFTEPLNFVGVIVVSLLAGVFPVLLLVATRRKGDLVPEVVYRALGNPLLAGGIYVIYILAIFLHGLVIWEDPVQRAIALAVGIMMVIVTVSMLRGGTFAPRLVVELREDLRDGQVVFNVTADGRPVQADVRALYTDGEREQKYVASTGEIRSTSSLQHIDFQIPAAGARNLKVWAHRVTPDGESESLPAMLEVHRVGEVQQFDMTISGGQVFLPLGGQTCRLKIGMVE